MHVHDALAPKCLSSLAFRPEHWYRERGDDDDDDDDFCLLLRKIMHTQKTQ